MNSSKRLRSAVIAALTVTTVALTVGAAEAAPAGPTANGVVKTAKMTVTGVNRAVAESHGFAVVTGPDGRQHAEPTPSATNPDGTPYNSRVHPDNVVEGDCGDSYVWIHPVGGYVSEIETGFDLDDDAVSYYWQVDRSDPYGSDNYSWGGGLAFRTSWTGEWDVHGGGPGTEIAGVDSSSDALLWDGDICTSEGATDAEYIF